METTRIVEAVFNGGRTVTTRGRFTSQFGIPHIANTADAVKAETKRDNRFTSQFHHAPGSLRTVRESSYSAE